MKKWRLALLLFLLPLSLEAMNGMSPIGYGVKSKGMGGVAVALPLDSFVVATNPAGIVDLGCRVDGELSYAFQSLKYKESGALTLDAKSNRGLWWPGIGLTASLSPSSSIGIAAYTLGVTDTQWSTALPLVGNPPNNSPFVNTNLQSYFLAISPSLAWRFCANHSFGIAANIIVGTMNIKGASLFTSSTVNASFLNNNGVDTAIGGSIRIGWLGKFLCNRLHLGASISSRSYMSRFSKYQGFFPSYGQFNWPWSGELGFAWLFRPRWTFSFDYRYLAWKSNWAMNFTNWVINSQMLRGLWNGHGLGWNNQSILKAGIAWTPWRCLTLRAGYNWCTKPIPPSEMLLAPMIPEIIQTHVTAGVTYRSCLGEWSCFYTHGFYSTLGSRGNPSDFDTATIHVSNKQNEVGLAWGYHF